MDAIVVGAGIGGLGVATGLRAAGLDVAILERAGKLAEVGAGISLWPNALRAMDALRPGLGRRIPATRWPARSGVFDRRGRLLAGLRGLSRHGLAPVVVRRSELHSLLLDAVGAAQVRLSSRVVAMGRRPSGRFALRCADGSEHTAELVVAADGIRSTLRSFVDGHPQPRDTGQVSWRGIVPPGVVPLPPHADPCRADGWAGEVWGVGEIFGISPLVDGGFYWYASHVAPSSGNGAREVPDFDDLRRRYASWPEPVPAILDAAAAYPALCHPGEILDPLPRRFVHDGMALLGDAAHAMSPSLGQGACQALEDAAVLAAAFRRHSTVDEALAWYDAERHPRATRIALRSRSSSRLSQVAGTRRAAVRDRALGVVPDRVRALVVARMLEGFHAP
ncbi:FAD-dependent monooxygenase [Longimycelium tulufanense]|uniref:FAD-dependent monooxygenase n=1 Tax=Longimycelium tulufanense TaxID=907463 RepID=UPI001664434E|nr:FAD-dependent monooxygenase [Longimycelium tulufanense]